MMMETAPEARKAADRATLDRAPGSREFRATHEHHGAAALGYGATEEEARADLARTLSFNLRHNGALA